MIPRVRRIAGLKAVNQELKDLFVALAIFPQTVIKKLITIHGIFNWLENAYAEVKLETCSDCGWHNPQNIVLSLTDRLMKRNTSWTMAM